MCAHPSRKSMTIDEIGMQCGRVRMRSEGVSHGATTGLDLVICKVCPNRDDHICTALSCKPQNALSKSSPRAHLCDDPGSAQVWLLDLDSHGPSGQHRRAFEVARRLNGHIQTTVRRRLGATPTYFRPMAATSFALSLAETRDKLAQGGVGEVAECVCRNVENCHGNLIVVHSVGSKAIPLEHDQDGGSE